MTTWFYSRTVAHALLLVAILFPLRVARANIFEWEYIDPANPSLGKRQSEILVPDGAGANIGRGVDLAHRDLTKAFLRGADLSVDVLYDGESYFYFPTDLTGANLSQADLAGSNLSGAIMTDTNFANADVRGAYLTGMTTTQLSSTASYQALNLSGTNLAGCQLAGINFANQNLSGANLYATQLAGANLSQANLANGVLSNSNLSNANLSGANLSGVQIDAVNFGGSNLTPSQLSQTNNYQNGSLVGIGLANTDLTGVNLSHKSLGYSILTNINLSQADLRGAFFGISDLTGAILTGAEIRGASFAVDVDYAGGTGLTTAQIYSTASYQMKDLTAIRLNGNMLAGSDFVAQNLSNAIFASATVPNANFSQANLTNADFSNALITGANFSGVSIRSANFNSAGISLTQIYSTADYQARDLTGIRVQGYGDNLAGVNLAGQNLVNSDFSGGNNLANADFSQANLTNANLSGATLSDTDFGGAVIRGADFSRNAAYGTGLTLWQLYSTASYQARDLTGITVGNNQFAGANFVGQDLTNAKFFNATLDHANLSQANLTNVVIYDSIESVNLSGAEVRGAHLPGLTKAQLYATASYQAHDLAGIHVYGHSLNQGVNLAHQDLTNADIRHADLDDANFSNAILTNAVIWAGLTGANFTGAIIRGAEFTAITKEQIYVTASYEAHDLTGIRLQYRSDLAGINLAKQKLSGALLNFANLTGANLSNADLTNVDFSGVVYCDEFSCYEEPGANLTNADLRGADARGANFVATILSGTIQTNFIRSDGHMAGFDIGSGTSLTIRDYDGTPNATTPTEAIPIVVEQQFTMSGAGALQVVFDADSWNSTIVFEPGIAVTRGGILDLSFAPGVDRGAQLGRQFRIFDWTGVTPTGEFQFTAPHAWDLSNFYTTGNVRLVSVPGDFDGDNQLTIIDINRLASEIQGPNPDVTLDMTGDGRVDLADLADWIHATKNTFLGDTNLDGTFDSGDLVRVFQSGQYEDAVEDNSTWDTGDWNADGDSTTLDLVVAFQDGGYERSAPNLVAAIPEPCSQTPLILGLCIFLKMRNRRSPLFVREEN